MQETNRIVSTAGDNGILKVLMENVREGLFIVEPETLRILEVNKKAAECLGYSESELMALKASEIFPFCAKTFHELLNNTDKPLTKKAKLLTKDQTHLDIDLAGYSIKYEGQDAILVIVFYPDNLAMNPTYRTDKEQSEDVIETNLDFPTIIGKSDQIHDVCRLIGLVAKTDATVLVQGESGTGKEVVAQAIHFHSLRGQGPLIKVNCSALTETLLESELFGHKKGSFTGAIQDRKGRFALANGGTIILDEIGSMSLSGQAKLLRVLQEKEFEPVGDSKTIQVDVRVIAITNTDLVKAIHEGKFREDLYYRLNTFPISVSPLRERKVDIPFLARHFLKKYAIVLRKQIEDIEPDAMNLLMNYCWPGNARELKNTIEYAVILEQGSTLKASSLPDKLRRKNEKKFSLKDRLQLAERQIIIETLSQTNWIKTRAAAILGIDSRNLCYFLRKHDIH